MDRIEKLALDILKKDLGVDVTIEDHPESWAEYLMEASQILREENMKRGD
jgi:hypothetical protein